MQLGVRRPLHPFGFKLHAPIPLSDASVCKRQGRMQEFGEGGSDMNNL